MDIRNISRTLVLVLVLSGVWATGSVAQQATTGPDPADSTVIRFTYPGLFI